MAEKILSLDGNSLLINEIERFITQNLQVKIKDSALKKMLRSRRLVEEWVAKDDVIYGVTTGFGEFSNVKISHNDLEQLQENLIVSHAVGCGELLPPFIVKIMMLLRVNALAKGHSGIRPSIVQLLVEMINNNIIPVVPSQGSVGSSGDLVQLSHLVLAMIGKGKVQIFNNMNEVDERSAKIISSKIALKKFGLQHVKLQAKEGLALINGTQMMTSFAAFLSARAMKLKKIADIAAALSHEALRATDKAFDKRLHLLRPYPGQLKTAENILSLIEESEIRTSHLKNDKRVQDAYSIRCVPQIHGASHDAIDYVVSRVAIEINSANDNPLIFPESKEHLEGGNFHGQPMALAMDFLAIALSELANVSERRTERLVNGALSQGLPRFLTKHGGINSGMMIAQYTAASLVSENKVLAHPASVDSIPTSANQEDHNSMGSIAAQKCYRILLNLENVLAIELMASAQGLEFLKPLKPGKGTTAAYNEIRKVVKPLKNDRLLFDDIKKINALVKNDVLLNAVEKLVKLS
ncbi:MAG: histidine ammonia-lyase [Ignavibacteria bacterium]|nr:histidine ammonia-lyase [Ignavibacteria bacterium]